LRITVDLAVARKRLEEMLDEASRSVATLEGENAIPASNGGRDIDTSDPGAALSDADRESAVIEALESQAAQIRAALERIDAGTFGTCVVCGQELPEERLDARPEAARCVADQARAESGR
jgi:RNA polymerase-binding transcription factor DksA